MQYIFYSYKNKICYADSQCLLTDLYVFKRFSIRKIKRSDCLVYKAFMRVQKCYYKILYNIRSNIMGNYNYR